MHYIECNQKIHDKKKYTLLLLFEKAKIEFRCEKFFMYFILYFTLLRSDVDLEKYGISKIVKVTPTFIFVKDKTEVGRIEGYNGYELFWWQVDDVIKSNRLK